MPAHCSTGRILQIAAAISTLGIALLTSGGLAAEGHATGAATESSGSDRQRIDATPVGHRPYQPHRYPHAYYPRYYGHGGYYGHYGYYGYYRGYGYYPRYGGYSYYRPRYRPPYAYYPRAYVPWASVYGLPLFGYGINLAPGGFYGGPRVGGGIDGGIDDRPPLPRRVYAECYYW